MKLNLHSRLLISLLALLVAGFLLLGVVLLGDAKNQIDEFRQTQAVYQAKTLAEASLDGLVSKDYELLEQWVQSSMPSTDYAYAALLRPDGMVLIHTDLTHTGKPWPTILNSQGETVRELSFNERPVVEVIYPAIIGNKILANAHVAYYLDTDYVLQKQTVTRIIGVLLVIFILIIIASHFVTRSIVTPIELLKKSIGNASLDKVLSFSHKLVGRTDEVGELTRAFKDMSERLTESHKNLTASLISNKAIVESAIDGVIVIDSHGQIESVNPAAEKLFGFSAEELINNNINLLMPAHFHSKHNEYMKKYKSSSHQTIIGTRRDIEGQCKDGSRFPIEIAIGEININNEKKFVGTVRDISLRYEHEKAILIAKEAAEESDRVKSEFLANISHELRTPMNAVMGYVDLLLLMDELSPVQGKYLKNASRSAHDLLDIINNILEFTNLDKGSLELVLSDFSIHEMIKAIINKNAKEYSAKQIELVKEIDPKIPDQLLGDSARIYNILNHFLNNAYKFTTEGEVKLAVQLENLKNKTAQVRFEVSDTGIGIEPDDTKRIFELFTQVDGSFTRSYGGTGIGLTLCNRLVEIMQGQIGVNSIPGEGSTFWFSLPLTVIASAPKPEVSPQKIEVVNNPGESKPDNEDKHILVVEDNPYNQKLIIAMLEHLGYEAEVVDNGLLGVEAIENGHYDLVFMDCQMPVMDGYEATKKIRKIEEGHIPIVAVTAHALDGDREKCIDSGMDDYMTKPFSKKDLQQMLSNWLV